MGERRKCELYLLRLVPHPLRDDFMTVGAVMVETDGDFSEVRFTRDWKRVECFAPDLELEILEYAEKTTREVLSEIRAGALSPLGADGIGQQLSQVLGTRFGALFEFGPVKAVETRDPMAEMKVIERDYLERTQPVEGERRTGRMGIVRRMEDAFAEAGVLEMLQKDIVMTEFTGESDPFKVDFGFRVGSTLKMFHGLALNVSREPAVTLAYRYGRIREGIRARGDEALLTAVISEEAMRVPTLPQKARQGWGTQRGEVASGVAMLRAAEIRVRGVEEMSEIADEVRGEIIGT